MRTPAPLAPEDPTHAGSFRLLGRLAQGGMGVVYLGRRDDSPESLVAVKMIRPELADQDLLRDRFAQEIAAAHRLATSPDTATHVARTVAADADTEQPWLATEFVPGPSLAEDVASQPQSPARVLETAQDLATAIAAMHDAGLLHGDLKPTNVVLGPDGLRLVDLGLAREHLDPDAEDDVALFGSPGWSPPERAGHGPIGPAVDVHGWGMTVAFAATGRPAFGTGRPHEVIERMRSAAPDLAGVPDVLLPLVVAALDPDPTRRPSADQLVSAVGSLRSTDDDVTAYVDAASVGPATGAWVPPTLLDGFTTVEQPRRRAVLPALAVAAVTVGTLLLGTLAFTVIGAGTAIGTDASTPTPGVSRPAAPTAAAVAARTSTAPQPTRDASPTARATTASRPAAAPVPAAPGKAKGKDKGHGPKKH